MPSTVKKIFLLGYSGHSYVVADAVLANGDVLAGYFEKNEIKNNPYQIAYCGFEADADLAGIVADGYLFPSVGSNQLRKKMVSVIEQLGIKETVVLSKSAVVSASVFVGDSSFVAPGAIINAFSKIGRACIINTRAVIEHECVVHDFVHICPGAVLAGNVIVEQNSFVGANAVIRQGQHIGKNVTIGAGSVVVNDLPDNTLWYGNPARQIK